MPQFLLLRKMVRAQFVSNHGCVRLIYKCSPCSCLLYLSASHFPVHISIFESRLSPCICPCKNSPHYHSCIVFVCAFRCRLITATLWVKISMLLSVRISYQYVCIQCPENSIASANDPHLAEALTKFHREGLSSNSLIKQRLFAEYGISAR